MDSLIQSVISLYTKQPNDEQVALVIKALDTKFVTLQPTIEVIDSLIHHNSNYSILSIFLLHFKHEHYRNNDRELFKQQLKQLFSMNSLPFLSHLLRYYTDLAKLLFQQKRFLEYLPYLQNALQNVHQVNQNMLTPIHYYFVSSLVSSKYYHRINLLGDYFTCASFLTAFENVVFWYLAGVCYIAIRNYHKAITCFKIALNSPSYQLSQIQVFCYQKLVLCSLILYGKIIVEESNIVTLAQKSSPIYENIASAYGSLQMTKKIVEDNKQALISDSNLGLAKVLIKSIIIEKIKQFRNVTFTMFSNLLTEIGVDIPTLEMMILDYHIRGFSTICVFDQLNNYIILNEDIEKRHIIENVDKLNELVNKINTFNFSIVQESIDGVLMKPNDPEIDPFLDSDIDIDLT